MIKRKLFTLMGALALNVLALSAFATETWYVDAAHGNNGYSGLSSMCPKRTIQAAINAASAGDWVIVAGGTYKENLTISKRLNLFSHEPAVAIVDGRLAGHCLLITEKAAGCVVDGFMFTRGAPQNSGNKYGGGIDCLADATIRHCTFKDNGNSSTTFAGGLHTSNRANVLVENCLFVGNYAWACGGASLTEGGSTATFDRCTVFGNKSDDYIGNQGGLAVANTGKIIVRSSILWGNTGVQIGAYGSYYGADSTIRVSYSCVQGGVAANGAGHFYNDGFNITTDPLFVNALRHNFWFHESSPCWRMGHPDFPGYDWPAGQRPHMGFWPGRHRPMPPPVWTAEVTLDPQGGDCRVETIKRFIGDPIGCLPYAERDGYDFLGWFDRAEGGRRFFPIEPVWKDFTLYAHWKERIPPLFQVVGRTVGIDSTVELDYRLEEGARDGTLTVNDRVILSTEEESGKWIWQPQQTGSNKLIWTTGKSAVTTTVYVAKLTFATAPTPQPPMPKDPNVMITPTDRVIENSGAGKGIIVTGTSKKWTAAASDPWIVLEATEGDILEGEDGGYVSYSVTVNTNIESRTGYVYVSGHVHTITQKGREASVTPENITYECEGGSESVSIDFDGRYCWDAVPNNEWITVSPTHKVAKGSVDCTIAPYNEVATRTGSITVGGKTVTIFQYGRRMKLASESASCDYLVHAIPVVINALAVTPWDATVNASWISIVDSDQGIGRKGGGTLMIAVGENPSWRARSGTVTIGTETFTITQAGRPAEECDFAIDPVETTASVNGANGHIAVTGTPDLPWSVQSMSSWLVVLGSSVEGTGNGNVFYTASPNTTLLERQGTIVITPSDTGVPAKTHTVTQPGAVADVVPAGYEFEANGGSTAVTVTVPGSIEWQAVDAPSWITILGSSSRIGSGSITIQASPNDTVCARRGTIKIAERTFTVAQKGIGFSVEYEDIVFGTDGDQGSFSVVPAETAEWEAVADVSWIRFMYGSNKGTGPAEVVYNVMPYSGDGTMRTGTITIGDKQILVTQRAYDLSISPRAAEVSGNAGAGEIAVSAGIDDVWHAIRTEDWITIEQGYDSKKGSGTVRYTYTDNDTGLQRSGKIVIDGEVYTITQASRLTVEIKATVLGHGHVEGAGKVTLGTMPWLTAVPDDGWRFLYWTGATGDAMQNPIQLTADVAKSVTATFEPLKPVFESATSSTEGVLLKWSNLAWASEYRIYRAPSSEIPSAPLVTLTADGTCEWLDETGDEEQSFWYWVEAVGADAQTESELPVTGMKKSPVVISKITYENLRGATHANPNTYEEGKTLAFSNPSAVTGYTFAGWDPSAITAAMTGDITVRATWTANAYKIVYHANNGSGTMEPTDCTYDQECEIAANGFVRAGFTFLGWSTEEGGAVVYGAGEKVSNLSSAQNGIVELWAVWQQDETADPVITFVDGDESALVTITCATPGASIYYTTNGRTPSAKSTLYTTPFAVTDTKTITAVAIFNDVLSGYAELEVTHVPPAPLTFLSALDEPKLGTFTTGGEADWKPVRDATSKVGDSCAVSGAVADDDMQKHTSYLEVKVSGRGTLSFWWRTDCEPDPRVGSYTYDHAEFIVEGTAVAWKDGPIGNGWEQVTKTFDSDGEHVIRWAYVSDGYEPEEGEFASCVWVDGVVWDGESATPSEIVVDDPNGKIKIPEGADPETLDIKIMSDGHDIRSYLNLPAALNGEIDLSKATIKEEIVKEALTGEGSDVKLDATNPSITTAKTIPGLTYTFREGTSLETLSGKTPLTHKGDGKSWTPTVTVKGGNAAFYSIGVTK